MIVDVKRDQVLQIRLSIEERAAWDAAAKAAELDLSEWIRRRCNGTTTIEAVTLKAPSPAKLGKVKP